MNVVQRLELRQGQSLVLTPQLLQAIKLLQMTHLDLKAYLDAELERNPLLAQDDDTSEIIAQQKNDDVDDVPVIAPDVAHSDLFPEDDRKLDTIDALLMPGFQTANKGGGFEGDHDPLEQIENSASLTLREHLLQQLHLAVREPGALLIGQMLIDALDDNGYLQEELPHFASRLGASMQQCEELLLIVQGFEPTGVGARNLSECLALQLKEQNRFDPAMKIMLDHLDLVAKRDMSGLQRMCCLDSDDIHDMISEIRRLEPKPGRGFDVAPVQFMVPDVMVRAASDGSWLVELNPDTLPNVLLDKSYYTKVWGSARQEQDKAYLTECLQNAHWLTRSLEQRSRTILKVASEIVRRQDGFLMHGVSRLKPLNLKALAESTGMHESTISRVTSNKSIATPRGTFEMKYFLSVAISGTSGVADHSSESVRYRVKQLVDAENPDSILSDDALVSILQKEGIEIARRTIAKYREALNIPSSVERRRSKTDFKKVPSFACT